MEGDAVHDNAERLKTALRVAGHNSAWLAREVGVNRSTASRWVRGKIEPTPEAQRRIAKALKVPLRRIFRDVEVAA